MDAVIKFCATIQNAKIIYDYIKDDKNENNYYFGMLVKIDDYIAIDNNNKIIKFGTERVLSAKGNIFKEKLKKNIENLNTIIKNVNDNINDEHIQKYIKYITLKKEAFDALKETRNKIESIKAEVAKAKAEAAKTTKTTAKYTQYAE